MTAETEYATFEAGRGFVAIAWNARGICSLRLPASTARAAETALRKRFPEARRAPPPEDVRRIVSDVVRYFEGERVDFSNVPVDLGTQDPFADRVYGEVRKLGWGETTTYGGVARALGADPRGARDVGQAMATNPVPLIVPCHRVLAAGNRIGGFSAPGGSASKAGMLRIEGIEPAPEPAKRLKSATQADFAF